MKKEEILDQFFKGEITQSELKGYLDRGDIDDSDVKLLGYLTEALEEKDNADARKFLNDLDDTTNLKNPSNWKTRIFILFGILIISVGLFFFFTKKEDTILPKAKVDVTQFAYLYPSDMNTRSIGETSENKDKIILQAKTYYANSDYDTYVKYYEEHKELISTAESSQLQYVSSLIALKHYKKVLKAVGEVDCKTKECLHNLEWYSIISFIATNQNENAKTLLINIEKDSKHTFYSDAELLMKELKNKSIFPSKFLIQKGYNFITCFISIIIHVFYYHIFTFAEEYELIISSSKVLLEL